ncbi:acyl carrier protein [Saccharopolyspora indica]|uniref:acyl carrier protein n=1 Tax=Saccharopolyspora indica TaxID=1229659 RepID=UPI0022EB4298|nr:acyl carrier protein [Saccharopolyspora indica]MDA3647912.1 acyl carrier protein [Saccharopolyspora indica]
MTAEDITTELLDHVQGRTRATVAADQDLFASGLVNSMFAMELVVHLEQAYGVAIAGPDLKLDNFRSVRAMTDLVLRLRTTTGV